LARYRGRTLEAYRYDLRVFFQWANDAGLEVLDATRAQIELYRSALDARGLAASTIDRRLSTVCGFYRFAHIDGFIAANPAQYVRRPRVHPSEGRGLDRGELAQFLFAAERVDHAHAALAALLGLNGLRVSEACETNIEDLGLERGHRTLRIIGKGKACCAFIAAALGAGVPPRRPDRSPAHKPAPPRPLTGGAASTHHRLRRTVCLRRQRRLAIGAPDVMVAPGPYARLYG
jgi:integrase